MFNKDSQIVQDYVLLIQKGLRELEDVPDYKNIREVIADALSN